MKPALRRKGRPLPWVVAQAKSLSPTGRKRDKWFATREKANAWIKDEAKRLRDYSDKAQHLTDEEKIEAAEAVGLARQHGFRMIEAVREKAANMDRDGRSIPVALMVDDAVKQLERERKSKRHIGTAKLVAARFKKAFGTMMVSQLTTLKIQKWLDSLSTLAPATLKQYRRYVSIFCEHGRIRGGYLQSSPTRDIRLSYLKNGQHEPVTILTPEQVKKLLEVAAPELRPYLALLAFAGLRPSEAMNLAWAYVLEDRLYISPGNSKTRSHRYVTIVPNLHPWLNAGHVPGKIHWSRRAFRKAVIAAGLDPWPEDCLRHSYGSYRLALDPDENKLAQEMGNSPQTIIQHYRRPVSKEDAEKYFSITP